MAAGKRTIIQSIGGISIPPRKKFKPEKTLVLRFALRGTIPSKKNNYIADRNWKKVNKLLVPGTVLTAELIKQINDVKPFIRKSNRYKKWEEATAPLLIEQAAKWSESYKKHGLMFPISKCSISYYHYWAENRIRDNSNKKEGLDDLLVDIGIISADAHQCLRKGDEEADVYRGEITDHITVITICAYEWGQKDIPLKSYAQIEGNDQQ